MKALSNTLKKPAAGVLGPLSCARTFTYATCANGPAALPDANFERAALQRGD